jgi:hypothetical protein
VREQILEAKGAFGQNQAGIDNFSWQKASLIELSRPPLTVYLWFLTQRIDIG